MHDVVTQLATFYTFKHTFFSCHQHSQNKCRNIPSHSIHSIILYVIHVHNICISEGPILRFFIAAMNIWIYAKDEVRLSRININNILCFDRWMPIYFIGGFKENFDI